MDKNEEITIKLTREELMEIIGVFNEKEREHGSLWDEEERIKSKLQAYMKGAIV